MTDALLKCKEGRVGEDTYYAIVSPLSPPPNSLRLSKRIVFVLVCLFPANNKCLCGSLDSRPLARERESLFLFLLIQPAGSQNRRSSRASR